MRNLFEARKARDENLKRVASHSPRWIDQAMMEIRHYPKPEATGEDIRFFITERIGAPNHHNAWGALINGAVRRGMLTFAGRYESMRTKRSHARRTPVYKVKQNV